LSRAFRAAAKKASPSVVTVLSYGQQAPFGQRAPRQLDEESGDEAGATEADPKPAEPAENELTGLGSGVIISSDGIVITNNHVINGAKKVVVQLEDESEYTATRVSGDYKSDVATLRIEREAPFPSAEIGDSDQLEIGDWVLAIGSPFRLEATVSAGIISAKDRKLNGIERGRLIQTDAAINPGNSGGPLVDLDGRVIAINTAIATRSTGYQGVGFAIPINSAKWIAAELDKHGQVRRSAIGVTMVELKPRIAAKFNLTPWLGVLVYQLIRDSAGERAGLKPLDVIVEFAGEKVRDPANLQELIERLPVGSTQTIKIIRDRAEIELQIELASVSDPTLQTAADTAETDEAP
jgi:serine protease Do